MIDAINSLLAVLGAGGVAILLFRLLSKPQSATLEKVKEQVAAADAMNKQIEELKNESTRATVDFESKLREYRARYGSGKRPGQL